MNELLPMITGETLITPGSPVIISKFFERFTQKYVIGDFYYFPSNTRRLSY